MPTFTMPALLTTMSIRPKSSSTSATIATGLLAVGEVGDEPGGLGAGAVERRGPFVDAVGGRGDRDGGALTREHAGAGEPDARSGCRRP